MGALGGEFGGEDEDVFAIGSELGADVVEEALDDGVFKKTGVSGAEAAEDFFPFFLIADDGIPCGEADGAGVGGIWQWHAEIFLLPGRIR